MTSSLAPLQDGGGGGEQTSGSGAGPTSDDEDYYDDGEGSGSGDFYEASGDHKRRRSQSYQKSVPKVEQVIGSLSSCTEYLFKVYSVYDESGEGFGPTAEVRAKTECVSSTAETTTAAPTTTTSTTEKTLVPVMDARVNGSVTSALSISWRQAKGVLARVKLFGNLDGRMEEEEILAIDGDAAPDYVKRSKSFAVDSCSSYEVSITIIGDDENENVAWSEEVKTPENPTEPLVLKDLETDVTPHADRGKAEMRWTSANPCVKQFLLRVETAGGATWGENVVMAAEPGQKVKVDLHMVPGILTLQNCETYSWTLRPKGMLRDQSAGAWYDGVGGEFQYVLDNGQVPNQVVSQEGVVREVNSDAAVMSWPAPFTCKDYGLAVKSHRYLYSDDSSPSTILNQSFAYDVTEHRIGDLLPCLPYEVELYENSELLPTVVKRESFVTAWNEGDEIVPLEEAEVDVWQDDKGHVGVEWADRCQERYEVETCRESKDCDDDVWNTVGVKKGDWVRHPSATVANLSPCSFYKLRIRAGETVLHERSLQTDFDAFKFLFEPPDLRVAQEAGDGKIFVEWTDSYPCIELYEVGVKIGNRTGGGQQQREAGSAAVKTIVEKKALSGDQIFSVDILNLAEEDFQLEQCSAYSIKVSPKLNATIRDAAPDWEAENEKTEQVFYFTHPVQPRSIGHESHDDTTALITWHHMPCHTGYKILLTGAGKQREETMTDEDKFGSFHLDGLSHCTQYNLSVWSLAGDDVSADPATVAFTTDHSDEVTDEVSATTDSISMTFVLQNTDCVSVYKVFLCDYDVPRFCQERAVVANQTVTFDGLRDGSTYAYQLTAYDASGTEVFISPERSVGTKDKVTAELIKAKVTDHSIQLLVDSSLFHDLEDGDVEADSWSATVNCKSADQEKVVTVTAGDGAVAYFQDLPPYTHFVCSGLFRVGSSDEEAEMAVLPVRTADGTPWPPEGLTGRNAELNKVELEWRQPEVANGELQSYFVRVQAHCRPRDKFCPKRCHAMQEVTVNASETSLSLDSTPDTTYTATVAAKTRHPDTGPPSDAFELTTFPASPAPPTITKLHKPQNDHRSLMVQFHPSCPLTGKTTFSAGWRCHGCVVESRQTHAERIGADTFRFTGLEGGQFYDVWVSAKVEGCLDDEHDCESSSDPKVVFVECDYECGDGTCINGRGDVACDFVRDCPDGSDEAGCTCEPPDKFECDNKYCVDARKRCDGNKDCGDGTFNNGSCKNWILIEKSA